MSGVDSNLEHPPESAGLRRPEAGGLRVGVDVGGTFTDLACFDGRSVTVVKVPSTPPDFERGVAHALAALAKMAGPAPIELIHGSTVATNALLERKGEPIAFVTTGGFRDLLHIGRQNRPELYNLHVRRPPAIVPREHCFAVPERVGPDGEVIRPLDEAAVREAIEAIGAMGLRHVAVCLLFGFANPEHERRIGEMCRAAGLTATLSCEVAPEFREYERASTTAVTASLRPVVGRYLSRLRESLPPAVGEIRILHGSGGTYPLEEAAAQAGRLVLSGPAGGAAGAAMMARLANLPDAVGFDMGGTSTDVALIRSGRPQVAQQHVFDGLPVHLPMLDIHTVGAGGGSIAYVDPGGSLRVGPRSAGAQPGPACYGRGGVEPTVTDANVVLGRIPTGARFGELELQPVLAREALAALAAQLGMTIEEAALGVLKVAEQNMAGAVRVVTAQRGRDPRQLALVSFGGAGGLHACAVAELQGMRTVILPPMAGVLSALGMVVAPDSVEVSQTVLALERSGRLDDDRLYAEFGRLNAMAMDRLPQARTTAVESFADCRWSGQSHELTIPVRRPSREAISEEFAGTYAGTYGAAPAGRDVEIVTLRLRRVGQASEISLPALVPEPMGEERIELVGDSGATGRARRCRRAQLAGKGPVAGPLLLIDPDATAFIPGGWSLHMRGDGIAIATKRPPGSDYTQDVTDEDHATLDAARNRVAEEG